MLREITPEAIRTVSLKRRFRGYDREETEVLLEEVAAVCAKAHSERDAALEQLATLQREQDEHVRRTRAELAQVNEQASQRERSVTELKARLARVEEARSQQVEESKRLQEQLAGVRAERKVDQEELREHRRRLARFELREKALVEQMAMFEAQLAREDAKEAFGAHLQPLSGSDRTAALLLRLERAVETIERDARREAETALKKARERANEIIQSAEVRRRRLEAGTPNSPTAEPDEYDPVAALDRLGHPIAQREDEASAREVGEASWTSRVAPGIIPERSP